MAQNFDPLLKSIQEEVPSIYDPFCRSVIPGSMPIARNVLDDRDGSDVTQTAVVI